MKLERHYNEKQLKCVKDFLNDLNGDFKPMSYRHITKKYFKNSRSLIDFCLKDKEHGLETLGIIEIRRHDRVYSGGKFTGIQNEYRMVDGSKRTIEPKMVSFNDRWIVVEEKHMERFKECLKITKKMFNGIPNKQCVVEECLINGLSQDIIDWIWTEYKIDNVINKINEKQKDK
jgi:hypothetical protein